MLSKVIEKALNDQIAVEAQSSQVYLAMASWAEVLGFEGIAQFMYSHSDEERMHMLKLIHFINERGGKATLPTLPAPKSDYSGVQELFEDLLSHELEVTSSINQVVKVCMENGDFTTNNFMQWYIAEQIEEEALARTILDKLKLVGSDNSNGLYFFDRDLSTLVKSVAQSEQGA